MAVNPNGQYNIRSSSPSATGPANAGFAAGIAGMLELAGPETPGSYTNGNLITLRGVNATGAAVLTKLQSADGAVEAINATLGAAKFTVDELPDRAGLGFGGGTQLGADVLRDALKTFALQICKINYDAGATSQLSLPIKIYSGNIYGNIGSTSISVGADVNNMQNNATLISIVRKITFSSNKAIQLSIVANNEVTLAMVVEKVIPYAYLVKP